MVNQFPISYTSDPVRRLGKYIDVVDTDGKRIYAFPIAVNNVGGGLLGFAENPEEFLFLWNGDLTNKMHGTLEIGVESTRFWIIGSDLSTIVSSPSGGDFSNDFSDDFFT